MYKRVTLNTQPMWKLTIAFYWIAIVHYPAECDQEDLTTNKARFTFSTAGSNFYTRNCTPTFNDRDLTQTSALTVDNICTDLVYQVLQTSTTDTSINMPNTTTSTFKNPTLSSLDEEDFREGLDPSEDPPQPTVSQKDYTDIMAVLDVVVIVTEMVSVALTATSTGVYVTRNMRCTTTVYLVAMNGADTVSGGLTAWSNLWSYLGGAEARKTLAYNYLTLVGTTYLSLFTRRCVYCLSVIVNLERFFVITFPLKARYFKIIRFPKLTVLVLMTLIFFFHIYLLLKYQVAASETGGYYMGFTNDYKANVKAFDIVSNSAKFLFAYIPLCLGLALSVALLVALRRHAAARSTLQEAVDDRKLKQIRDTERQLARTIWLSTLLFTLLSLPSNTVHLVSTYHPTFGYLKLDHRLFRLVSRFCYLGLVATRYANFFSYLCLSTGFRRNFIRCILPRKMPTKIVGSLKDGELSQRSKSSPSEVTKGDDGSSTGVSVVSSQCQRDCSFEM